MLHPIRCDLSKPSFLLLPCHFKQPLLPSVICLLTNAAFLAPVFYRPPTAPACFDPFCPQRQFILFVECLQLSCHKNTPVSRIVSASCIYYLLLYGSIVTYRECRCKSRGGLTLTNIRLLIDIKWKLFRATSSGATRNKFILPVFLSVSFVSAFGICKVLPYPPL